MDDLTEYGPPQHAWYQVAPGAGENHARDEAEGMEEERHIEQEHLDANANLQQEQGNTSLLQLLIDGSDDNMLTCWSELVQFGYVFLVNIFVEAINMESILGVV